jgi:hypothetical protein
MAYGTLQTDVINSSTGLFSTNNAYSGIARAWVTFNGGTTATTLQSFNVSSVTYNTTGIYTVNFSTALSSSNSAGIASAGIGSNSYAYSAACSSLTTTSCKVGVVDANGTFNNGADTVCVVVHNV